MLRTANKSDQAYDAIKGLVVKRSMTLKKQIIIKELAEETGYGITPVREAVIRLQAERLIFEDKRKGFVLSPSTIADCRQVYEAIFHILNINDGNSGAETIGRCLYLRFAARRFDEKDENSLASILEHLYTQITQLQNNSYIEKWMDNMIDRSYFVRRVGLSRQLAGMSGDNLMEELGIYYAGDEEIYFDCAAAKEQKFRRLEGSVKEALLEESFRSG